MRENGELGFKIETAALSFVQPIAKGKKELVDG
jgi:hypothetical protein